MNISHRRIVDDTISHALVIVHGPCNVDGGNLIHNTELCHNMMFIVAIEWKYAGVESMEQDKTKNMLIKGKEFPHDQSLHLFMSLRRP